MTRCTFPAKQCLMTQQYLVQITACFISLKSDDVLLHLIRVWACKTEKHPWITPNWEMYNSWKQWYSRYILICSLMLWAFICVSWQLRENNRIASPHLSIDIKFMVSYIQHSITDVDDLAAKRTGESTTNTHPLTAGYNELFVSLVSIFTHPFHGHGTKLQYQLSVPGDPSCDRAPSVKYWKP